MSLMQTLSTSPGTLHRPTLVVLLGPTGVGKTKFSLELASELEAPILSADSRQIYREIPIGTAAPSAHEQAAVAHFFVGSHSIHTPYSASLYETEAMRVLEHLFLEHRYVVLSGGSMMYIDALCSGIDDIPDVRPEVRREVYRRHEFEGLAPLLEELARRDPIYYSRVDRCNYKRVLHGLEVCLSTGQPFSSFHTGAKRHRPFEIIKIGLNRPRGELYDRINERVLEMMRNGLEQEARAVYPYRSLNALNTVGYKELFAYFDGEINLDQAVAKIQRNSRVYARKQLTWWQRDAEIRWFSPQDLCDILAYIRQQF